MFSAHGVAAAASGYRAGARHALMLFATGASVNDARTEAIAGAAGNGWMLVEIKREKELDGETALIDDDVLRSAAEVAITDGSSVVVYAQEIPPNG